MAGKIEKENLAIVLAKCLLVDKDLEAWGMRYENNPRATVAFFMKWVPGALQELAETYPEFVPIYENFNENMGRENAYPNAFCGVIDAVVYSGVLQKEPIKTDMRFSILMAALITNAYSEEDKPLAEGFLKALENGEDITTGFASLMLLATALYACNYEGDFCDLMSQHYYKLLKDGYGEN